MKDKRTSIGRFLLWSLLGMVGGLALLSAIASFFESRHEADELFDAQLAQHAKLLRVTYVPAFEDGKVVPIWHHGREYPDRFFEDEELERDISGHAYENNLAFQHWDASGKLTLRTENAPTQALAPFAAGYSNQQLAGEIWRVFALADDKGGWYLVAHSDEIRDELAEGVAAQTIYPMLLILPLMAIIIRLAIRRGLRPLEKIADAVRARSAETLTPVADEQVPVEVLPLVTALNSLMARLHSSFAQQKRFIADASHELRTPLAALQIHAENALASQGTDRDAALQRLMQGIDRTHHLVQQLLALSRVEADSGELQHLELRSVLDRVCDELTPLAQKQHKRFDIHAEHGLMLQAKSSALHAMLRNLLDNALRYSPPDSVVTVQLHRDQQRAHLRIRDHGPGIPEEWLGRVFEPFLRVLGTGQDGTGLGLSIVQEVVTRLRGEIRLANAPDGGLQVDVWLPLAASPTPQAANTH